MFPETFFTGDHHFFHKAVSNLRGFSEVDEMNEVLIQNHNSLVKLNDTVWILGDLFLSKPETYLPILTRLNGNLNICWGNHDRDLAKEYYSGSLGEVFQSVQDIKLAKVIIQNQDSERIFLSHYAHRVWERSHYGMPSAFAHSHGTLPEDIRYLSLDVGLDCNNLYPMSYSLVKEKLSSIISKRELSDISEETIR